jgi:hypothetical protein
VTRNTKNCSIKQRLRQLGQKTAWSLNFDVNAFDFADKVRITMKYPHSIPLWRTIVEAETRPNEELLPGNVSSRVVLSSVGTKWNDVEVEQHHVRSSEVADAIFKRHVISVNIGHCITGEFKKEGRFQRDFKARGAISFLPSDQPFSGWMKAERGVFANVLLLALDPVFVSRVAKELEFDADRIELIEQRRGTTLHFTTLLWHCGPESRPALPLTGCMGRDYQQRSPLISYANMARQC